MFSQDKAGDVPCKQDLGLHHDRPSRYAGSRSREAGAAAACVSVQRLAATCSESSLPKSSLLVGGLAPPLYLGRGMWLVVLILVLELRLLWRCWSPVCPAHEALPLMHCLRSHVEELPYQRQDRKPGEMKKKAVTIPKNFQRSHSPREYLALHLN